MKKYITILLFLLPCAMQAQLRAPDADAKMPTNKLTGNPDSIYVFYDDHPVVLEATDSTGALSNFTWKKLNIADTTLDVVFQTSATRSSTLAGTTVTEGGYQVIIERTASPIVDTFTTWVFVDTFRIDGVTYERECDVLRLDLHTTPHINASYMIYNFKEFLNPPYVGETILRGATVHWTPSRDIHEGVDDVNDAWMHNSNDYRTFIDAPPPLYSASYTVEVTDLFGKKGTYTTGLIEAISVYPKMTVEKPDENIHNTWIDAGKEPKGEALFRLRFSHDKSVNAGKYVWKGFANAALPDGDKTLMWTDTLVHREEMTYPRMWHKGQELDGYVPGSYIVRLIALNNYCADSTEIKHIIVEPSSFLADAIPNAFTPNGDGLNDYFTFIETKKPVSMEHVNIYIYNRSGGLVYRYEGRLDAWNGWDGHYMGSGNEVADGIYFYVINGEGWDTVLYNNSEYKGYLHLFR